MRGWRDYTCFPRQSSSAFPTSARGGGPTSSKRSPPPFGPYPASACWTIRPTPRTTAPSSPAPPVPARARATGARMPLIAYNTNLNPDRLDVAKKIAAAIRHSSGGFRYVKAAGFALTDRGIVQVSMNLTNYEKTPIFRVFETVKREAERYGVSILESEIVGLIPSAALNAAAEYYLQVAGFTPDQVLENRLRKSKTGE